MIEVFKTNVKSRREAKWILHKIHKSFNGYQANFDLNDCDRILRVKSFDGDIQSSVVMNLLKEDGFFAEILDDTVPS